jgi:LPLT family lysophospholipid transporter-like MFS transporter
MNRSVAVLLIAQFLTAFADNAILFIAIAMVLKQAQLGDWYVPALQSVFLVAFVIFAPWVGRIADRYSKPHVLIAGNILKAGGALLMVAQVEPLLAYALIGLGAAVYGPAKYGVLPEIVSQEDLVKANGWVEGSTIAAIVLGTVVGARLADINVSMALWIVAGTFGVSALTSLAMPRLPARGAREGNAVGNFVSMSKDFLVTARARFAMLGAALFWSAAAVLRVLIVAWAPLALGLASASDIAELTLVLAIGIVAGSLLAPRLVPIEDLRRARLAGYLLGVAILILALVSNVWGARLVLVIVGIAGGLFVVPINAALQEIGHRTIGSGGAVAIQSFFENLAMLMAVGIWTFAASIQASPVTAIAILGVAVVVATLLVAWRLPQPEPRIPGDTPG